MFGSGNNEQNGNGQNQSIIGGLLGNKAKAIKTKVLMALLPGLAYAFIFFIVVLTCIAVFQNFNSMFSMLTGQDPTISGTDYDKTQHAYDVNGSERYPGYEMANDVFNSYSEPNTGLDKLISCDQKLSFVGWVKNLFGSDSFENACQMMKYIQSKANDLEKDYKWAPHDKNSDNPYLDRGLLISTFYYSYIWRNKNAEAVDVKEEDDVLIGSDDPLTIINYMIKGDNEAKVKITKSSIEEMYKNQVLPVNYISLSWKPIYTIDVGHYEDIEGCKVEEGNKDPHACQKRVHDYDEFYYGCEYETHQNEYELDLNIFKIYLRDYEKIKINNVEQYKLIGKAGTVVGKDLKQTGTGYIGARNYAKTVESTSGYCNAGTPVLAEHSYVMSSLDIPEGDDENIVSQHVTDYVLMGTSQAFIEDIKSNGKDNYQAFLTKADYTTDENDNMSFVYNGTSYEVDYLKGFINDKFSYMKSETDIKYNRKVTEQIIDIIFSNAESMNAAMNFPYTSTVDESLATNVPFVIGDEAAPLGDFPWVPTSDCGWRGAIAGTTHTSANFHSGLDMAGSGIEQKAIYAWKPGKVTASGYDASTGCGNFVRIQHEGANGEVITSLYCHMYTTPKVSVGDVVAAGQQIGIVGSTGNSSGPHLHFSIRVDGELVHPCLYLNVGRTCSIANTNGVIKNGKTCN